MSSQSSLSWDWHTSSTISRIVIENRPSSGHIGRWDWGEGMTVATCITQTPSYGWNWNWDVFSLNPAVAEVPSTVQSLWPLDEHKQAKNEEHSGEEIDCSMCLESIKQGSSIYRLSCGHKFHSNRCINNGNVIDWIREHGTCPYCRAKTEL